MHALLRLLLAVTISLLAAGCQTIGPGSIQRDRLDYADAIAGSWREQTLLNIVKLRYFYAPVFLEVSSAIGSYTLRSEVSLAWRIFPQSRVNTYRNYGAVRAVEVDVSVEEGRGVTVSKVGSGVAIPVVLLGLAYTIYSE